MWCFFAGASVSKYYLLYIQWFLRTPFLGMNDATCAVFLYGPWNFHYFAFIWFYLI